MIERPTPPPPQDHAGRNAATLTALILLLGCAGGLLFLVALVVPGALGILLIGMVFVPMTMMHYLVWGRLMEQHNERTKDENSITDP